MLRTLFSLDKCVLVYLHMIGLLHDLLSIGQNERSAESDALIHATWAGPRQNSVYRPIAGRDASKARKALQDAKFV